MLSINLYQVLIEFGVAFIIFNIISFIGSVFIKNFGSADIKTVGSRYGQLYWKFLAGLLIVVYIYSVIVTGGLTVNILLLLIIYFLFIKNYKQAFTLPPPVSSSKYAFAETAVIIFLAIIILHVFPESEYKQADSFFYLKIAESLNITGQENVSHYFNIYNSNYHGLEPYHYFEIWITSIVIRCTDGFYASINIHRFVTQAILLAGVIVGLYYLAEELLKEQLNTSKKIFCWSLLFILPNFLTFFPFLYKVFVSDFEGNILERPNFRIIYLLIIPVVIELYKKRLLKGRVTYLLLLLSIVSFKCTVVVVPAIVAYNLYLLLFVRNESDKFEWLPIITFLLLFGSLYFLFPVRKMPGLYGTDILTFLLQTSKSWKFILFSSVMSVVYMMVICAVFILPLFFIYRRHSIEAWESIKRLKILSFIAAVGLLLARILFLKDNAYQFLFVTHIIATIFIWLSYLLVLKKVNNSSVYLVASLFLSAMFFIKPLLMSGQFTDTFKQNGNFVYEGRKYSNQYLKDVNEFFDQNKHVVGGYICDSNFYRNTYYSRRNPNVYFLPVTYIISSRHNRNFEFCLSDSSAIMTNEENPVFRDYLNNAIHRSFFYQYRQEKHALNNKEAMLNFIKEYHLSYLITTKDVALNPALIVRRQITDPVTGEKFLIFQ